MNSEDRIKDLEAQIAALPEGYISKKNIRGKETFYRQWKEDGKLKSKYIAREDLDYMIFAIKERKELQLLLEMEINRRDLASNPEVLYTYFRAFFLSRDVGIGVQLYEKLIEKKAFYVDKTKFILEWWNSVDDVTLITRPRRFGKTMTLSMVECFFSNRYAGRSDLFDTMEIWRSQRMRELQGTYPVISLSFGAIKFDKPEGIFTGFKNAIQHMIHKHKYHMSDLLDSHEKEKFDIYLSSSNIYELIDAIPFLCQTLYRVYGKKPIILIDEYDTPMLSAWTNGIWDDCSKYMRSLFNAAFKTNTCYTKVLITGISRISKESFFSDLNNLSVYSVSSDKYSTYFGFTEDEVVEALVHQKLDTFDEVKSWYDGFTFGNSTDIYNPWSITNYLASRKFEPYWAHSASNALLQQIFRGSGEYTKKLLEDLIAGKTITCKIKEDFTFSRIEDNLNDALSLLLCSGYLKIVNIDEDFKYEMKITNKEVEIIFNEMIEEWFKYKPFYNEFIEALLSDDVDSMNIYLTRLMRDVFSFFDTSGEEPERFYHGFVLGLIVELKDRYIITSNRESGLGRYDVMLQPRDPQKLPAMILEFKAHRPRREASIEDTAKNALKQIIEKDYAATLIDAGIKKENIYKYGFAFKGKEVYIMDESELD